MSQRREEEDARERLAEVARGLSERGMLVAGLGSLSLRLGNGRLLLTPAHGSSRALRASQLVVVEGARVGGPEEARLHRLAYEQRPAARVVGLLQLPSVASLAMAGVDVGRCLLDVELANVSAVAGGNLAPGEELGRALVAALAVAAQVRIERFGVLLTTSDLDELEARAERFEHAAAVTLRARMLGRAAATSEQRLTRLAAGLGTLGLRAVPDCGRCNACSLGTRHHGGDEAFAAHIDAVIEAHLSRPG